MIEPVSRKPIVGFCAVCLAAWPATTTSETFRIPGFDEAEYSIFWESNDQDRPRKGRLTDLQTFLATGMNFRFCDESLGKVDLAGYSKTETACTSNASSGPQIFVGGYATPPIPIVLNDGTVIATLRPVEGAAETLSIDYSPERPGEAAFVADAIKQILESNGGTGVEVTGSGTLTRITGDNQSLLRALSDSYVSPSGSGTTASFDILPQSADPASGPALLFRF